MICERCGCADECSWYESYKNVVSIINIEIGTDTNVGVALKRAIDNNPLLECEYYESKDGDAE